MKILESVGMEKRDFVKAGVATSTVQEFDGENITLTGVLIGEKPDTETGESREIVCLKTSEDEFISSISATVKESIVTIMEAFTPNEFVAGIPVIIKSRNSKAGRKFFYIDLQ